MFDTEAAGAEASPKTDDDQPPTRHLKATNLSRGLPLFSTSTMETSSSPTIETPIRPVMDRKEAASYLRVSVRLITNLVASRRLRPARIGRRLVFKRSELDRYLDLLMAQSA